MPTATHLNHVIIVGVKEPDAESASGRRARRYLSQVTGVSKDDIHFFEPGTTPSDIVRNSFIKDKSREFGFQIDNALCIGTEAIGAEYRHTLKSLKNVKIAVKTGYQAVDLEQMSEAEMSEWFETGRYTPRGGPSLPVENEDEDGLLDSLLSTEEGEKTDISSQSQEDSTSEPEEESQPVKEQSTVPADESPDTKGYRSVFPESDPAKDNYDSFLSGLDSLEPEDGEQDASEDEPEIKVGSGASGGIYPDGMEDNFPGMEKEDLDYVDEIQAARERRKRELAEAQAQLDSDRAADNKPAGWEPDSFGESSNEMYRQASTASANDFHEDGTRKTYKAHLSESDRLNQEVRERQQEKFGSLSHLGVGGKGEDIRYVGQGQGRIILCTSGKGGVGKSVIAAGMAMALSLARAAELSKNPGSSQARTWLIESDYNSPQLAVSYKTGTRHIGNVADVIGSGGKGIDNAKVRQAIEDNVVVDPESGVHILACPTLSSRRSSSEMPLAILLAVKYASDQGDDVIIDHGNLTSGTYSELDQVLSMSMAHRVVIVCNMGCMPETKSTLSVLCSRERNSVVQARPVQSVSVVLNTAYEEQHLIAQKELRPFEIIQLVPPMDPLRPENSRSGETTLVSTPKEVQQAVISRCGHMLTKLGYQQMNKYFTAKTSYTYKKKSGKRSFFSQLSDFMAKS